jgi:hypothetical protein
MGMGRNEGRPVTIFIRSEKLTRVDSALHGGAGSFTRAILLKRLLREAEVPCITRQQLDSRERHLAGLRQLIYKQVQLIERDKLKSHDAERVQNLLAIVNDLMADYQTLRRRISTVVD